MQSIDENEIQKILDQFKKVQEIAGESPDDEYQKELDNFINSTFSGMDDDFIKMQKTKLIKVKKSLTNFVPKLISSTSQL
jgi:hypothetical protein